MANIVKKTNNSEISTSSLFTITYYFKVLNADLVNSEKVKVPNTFAFRTFWLPLLGSNTPRVLVR